MSRLALAVLAAVVACAHGQAITTATPGISCATFDTLMCVDKADGTFFENNADCGTPFCHQTYVVCYGNAPTVQSCPDGTVWSQESVTCVSPIDAPGACPEVCGQLDTSLCVAAPDGTVLSNPVDCKVDGKATTFLYCVNEIPVATICAEGTFFDEGLVACVGEDGGLVAVNKPTIPGYTEEVVEPVEDVQAPAPAPAAVDEAPEEPKFPSRDYTLALSGKEVTELSTSDIEDVFSKAAGFKVDAAEPTDYEATVVLKMPNFVYVLNDETRAEITEAMPYLVAEALSDYDIGTEEVTVEDISGSISTASAKETGEGQTVYTTISVSPAAEEKQAIMDLVAALPQFDTLFSEAVARIANSSKHVSSDLAAYLAEQQVTASDYNVGAEVTVSHTEGKEGASKLEKAVAKGKVAKQLSAVLGEQVITAEAVEEKIKEFVEDMDDEEAAMDKELVVEVEGNAAVAATGLLTALAGAAVTLALVL